MTLFEALTQGRGSAIYTLNQPDYVSVEQTPDGYRIIASKAEGTRDTHRLHEHSIKTYAEMLSGIVAEPFMCDTSSGWEPFPAP